MPAVYRENVPGKAKRWSETPSTKPQAPEKFRNRNTKHQAPNTKETPSSKLQIAARASSLELGAWSLVFGVWDLVLLWSLEFGIWRLLPGLPKLRCGAPLLGCEKIRLAKTVSLADFDRRVLKVYVHRHLHRHRHAV